MVSARFTSRRRPLVGRRLGRRRAQLVETHFQPTEYLGGVGRKDLLVLALEGAQLPWTRENLAPRPVWAVHQLRHGLDGEYLDACGIGRGIIGAYRPLDSGANLRCNGELPRILDVEGNFLQPLVRIDEPGGDTISEQLGGGGGQFIRLDL